MSRKRGRMEMESSEPAVGLSLLDRLRNMWEFANLMQYIFIFGKAVKIDEDLIIEVTLPPRHYTAFGRTTPASSVDIEYDTDPRCITGSRNRMPEARAV